MKNRELDQLLDPIADDIVASVLRLGEKLKELDLISEENPGTPRWHVDLGCCGVLDGIGVEEPERRIYHLDGPDTVVGSRMRDDGQWEHSVFDENGLPIEWRTTYKPRLN